MKVVVNPVPVISSLSNYQRLFMFVLCSDPPEYEVKSAQASVRRGASQTLECEVHGDQPISIVWHREGQPSLQFNPR